MQNLQNDFMFQSLDSATAFLPSQEKLYEEVTINSKKIFKCQIPDCGKTFKFKSEMERHLVTHTGQRSYICSFPGCGKTFKRNDALINHSKTHSRTVLFTCPEAGCGAQFTTKSAARYHLLKHKGEKTFTCNFPGCAKSFLTYAQLKQHEKASYYHQKVGVSYSTGQYSPAQESIQELDGVSPLSNGQFFGLDSVDGLDASDFADIDFEELLKNSTINEPVENNFSFPSKNFDESLEGKCEEMTTASNSLVALEKTSAGNLGKRSLQERLIDILDYVIEENKQLKKKLKYNTDNVQNNCAERDQLMDQSDVDLFFRSSFGSEDEEDKNSEISNRYFF
jgi:uncharacterized Zn-finger protein